MTAFSLDDVNHALRLSFDPILRLSWDGGLPIYDSLPRLYPVCAEDETLNDLLEIPPLVDAGERVPTAFEELRTAQLSDVPDRAPVPER
jgi:hypothetical protein